MTESRWDPMGSGEMVYRGVVVLLWERVSSVRTFPLVFPFSL